MKYLGLIVTNNLSWTEHAKTRSAKSLKAFFSLKRNLANSSTISTKKNGYRGSVVPIISYASSLWKPSKSELAITEKVQHRASILILGTNKLSYKSRLQILHLLPLSLYHEKHVVLLFARIINSKTDIDWEKYVQIIDTGITRSHAIPSYTSKCFRLKKCESDFWQRACSLSNKFNRHLNQDVIQSTQCKEELTTIYWRIFTAKFNENLPCTWRLCCDSTNCINTAKLNFYETQKTESDREAIPLELILNPSLLFLLLLFRCLKQCLRSIDTQHLHTLHIKRKISSSSFNRVCAVAVSVLAPWTCLNVLASHLLFL